MVSIQQLWGKNLLIGILFIQIFKVYCNNNMGKDSKRFQIDQNNLTPILRHSLQLELQHLRDLREREREYFRYNDNYLKNCKFEFRLVWCIGIWDTLNPKCITLLGLFKYIHQNKLYI